MGAPGPEVEMSVAEQLAQSRVMLEELNRLALKLHKAADKAMRSLGPDRPEPRRYDPGAPRHA